MRAFVILPSFVHLMNEIAFRLMLTKKTNAKSKNLTPWLTLISFIICFSPSIHAGAPDFPPPPQASVEWVGQNIEINGIKSAVRAFHSKKSIEEVVGFYRKEWRNPVGKDMPGYMETIEAAPWYIISRAEDGYLLTVQVQVNERAGKGSWGYLSLGRLPDMHNFDYEQGKGIPKMRDSHVLNESISKDPGKKAKTLIISNNHTLQNNVAFYRSHYEGLGWTSETDMDLGGAGKMHSLVFKTKRNRITMIFIKDNDKTRIVINSVTNSIF